MIEKLEHCINYVENVNNTMRKVNEIIELLNAIVVDVDDTKCVDGSKTRPENVQQMINGLETEMEKRNLITKRKGNDKKDARTLLGQI